MPAAQLRSPALIGRRHDPPLARRYPVAREFLNSPKLSVAGRAALHPPPPGFRPARAGRERPGRIRARPGPPGNLRLAAACALACACACVRVRARARECAPTRAPRVLSCACARASHVRDERYGTREAIELLAVCLVLNLWNNLELHLPSPRVSARHWPIHASRPARQPACRLLHIASWEHGAISHPGDRSCPNAQNPTPGAWR